MVDTDIEVLLVCEATSELWPVNLLNPLTGSSVWSYKGSELQSEHVCDVTLVAGEYLILSVAKRPVVLTIGFDSKSNRLIDRSILPSPSQSLAVSSDGWICCGAIDEKLYTWTCNGGQLHSIVSSHYQPIVKICFTTDNYYVLTGGKDGCIVCYNVGDLLTPQEDVIVKAQPIFKWSCHSLSVSDLKVGCGGIAARVYSVSLDQTVKIHSLSSGELLMTLFFDCPLTSCAVDNAESRLFIGTTKGDIRQVDMFVEPVVRERHIDLMLDTDDKLFKGHKQKINYLSVNSDGSLLASASSDQTVKIWYIISRQCIRTVNSKGDPLKSQFVVTPPAVANPNYCNKTIVHSLQKNVADKCEEVVSVRISDRPDKFDDKSLEMMLEQLTEEETSNTNESNDAEFLRHELAKAKQLNANLYRFCVDKIINADDTTK